MSTSLENAAHRPRLGPLTDLDGVGPARAASLAALGLFDIGDLLFLAPRRLVSGADDMTIAQATSCVGREVKISGRIEKSTLQRFGRRSTLRVTVRDETGSLPALFFNQAWLQKRFKIGDEVTLRGKVVDQKGPALASPRIGSSAKPLLGSGEVATIYPAPEGITSDFIAQLVRAALTQFEGRVTDPLAPVQLARLGLTSLDVAVRKLHQPTSAEEFDAARRRMALEQLLELSARFQERRAAAAAGHALRIEIEDEHDRAVRSRFAFALTGAQGRVANELRADLARSQPMRRLLQGDVGSGKTAMGLYAALLVASARGQTAFMAPTELLAEQHFDGLRRVLERAGLSAGLLTGSLGAPARRALLLRLVAGEIDVVFGTHALFSTDVAYNKLVLCVIDEQHRFGVAQRTQLLDKGRDVHALLMTATPIPRTQALALYGDLDISVLDEKPPGRGAVTTQWVRGNEKRALEKALVERVDAGERVYWVVPRIGDGEEVTGDIDPRAMSAEVRFERLLKSPLARHGVELAHGRMPSERRAQSIERFRTGEVRTLVATTVIEVGVDVPEATAIVIEVAERLGLAQLHQLRGRVGRSSRPSACYLIGAPSGSRRFEALLRTHDGFEIAEEDLRQRGMGDLMGVRQAGENSEGLADIEADLELFLFARRAVAEDPRVFECYRSLSKSRPTVHAP